MKTSLGHDGKLSQNQITRLGGLIAVICGRTPYEHILSDLTLNGFHDGVALTQKDQKELIRLTSMAGLRQEQFAPTLTKA